MDVIANIIFEPLFFTIYFFQHDRILFILTLCLNVKKHICSGVSSHVDNSALKNQLRNLNSTEMDKI